MIKVLQFGEGNFLRTFAEHDYMLNCGATTFWETEKGEYDFDGAGSLCHC